MSLEQKFLETMTDEKREVFRKRFGFPVERISEIGFDKYSKAMGWENEDHLTSWETDKVSVIICPACNNDFGPWEIDLGLCEHCVKDFYSSKVSDLSDIENVSKSMLSVGQPLGIREAFYLSPGIREKFRRKDGISSDLEGNDLLGYGIIADALLSIMVEQKNYESVKDVKYRIMQSNVSAIKRVENTPVSLLVEGIADDILNNDRIKVVNTPNGKSKPANAWIFAIYLSDKVGGIVSEIVKFELKGGDLEWSEQEELSTTT